jgi:5,10-methylene-tetrahydrofolate dehydrogenase/methenyl tetrahydrofolate cyclohydrolase
MNADQARFGKIPGGVGPMTIAMLLQNTLAAARATVDAGEAGP